MYGDRALGEGRGCLARGSVLLLAGCQLDHRNTPHDRRRPDSWRARLRGSKEFHRREEQGAEGGVPGWCGGGEAEAVSGRTMESVRLCLSTVHGRASGQTAGGSRTPTTANPSAREWRGRDPQSARAGWTARPRARRPMPCLRASTTEEPWQHTLLVRSSKSCPWPGPKKPKSASHGAGK